MTGAGPPGDAARAVRAGRPVRARRAAGSPRPSAASVRLGLLFGLGSVCFAVGSLPLYAARVAPEVAAWTFVVGSVLFTSAAAFQVAGTPRDDRLDRAAALVQLVGTVCFNVSTYAATRDLAAPSARRLVWAPDVYGSVCFLVASVLACVAVRRAVRPRAVHGVPGTAASERSAPGAPGARVAWRRGSVDWWVAALNLAGSVAFGAAAVAARYVAGTTEETNVALVNAGTCAGAVCFLVGAALLPVGSVRERSRARGAAA
ncbi:YrhK family protein [Cellulosimicrobium cellulans]|uniref:YrhK family protein n=1 Tax=Cellulosimicrobium cellulans TaxID=1710 RepID=UPI00130D65D0|nr:YrhK family protein [Cellulosimicrobium cellulans]